MNGLLLHLQNNMKKYTVTIGLAAHNEEKNIKKLLNALMQQNISNFVLKEILVLCDGCTDNTEQKALEVAKKYPVIHVLNDGRRVGKGQRVSEVFRIAKGDIIVTIDADLTLVGMDVFNNIIPYFKDKEIGLVGGKCIVVEANTLFQKVQETYIRFWRDLTYSINNGNNVHTHLGPLSAIRTSVARKIQLPLGMTAEDHFVYFKVKVLGEGYIFAPDVVVGYKIPKYLKEYLKQYTRYLTTANDISDYFGEVTDSEYSVPRKLKVIYYLKHLFLHPLTMSLAIGVQIIERLYLKFININKNIGTWDVVSSTK